MNEKGGRFWAIEIYRLVLEILYGGGSQRRSKTGHHVLWPHRRNSIHDDVDVAQQVRVRRVRRVCSNTTYRVVFVLA